MITTPHNASQSQIGWIQGLEVEFAGISYWISRSLGLLDCSGQIVQERRRPDRETDCEQEMRGLGVSKLAKPKGEGAMCHGRGHEALTGTRLIGFGRPDIVGILRYNVGYAAAPNSRTDSQTHPRHPALAGLG